MLKSADKNIIEDLKNKAKTFRIEIIKMLFESQAGHPGGSLSEIDILTALYYTKLNINPKNPKDPDRDRFILSKGHASPGLYAVLAEKGFFPKKELMGFRKINRLLQGHTDIKIPGIEMSGGSLGQGLSFANGVALAGKLDKKKYKVYIMMGDGETQEGEVWEAAMNAAHYRLDNITAIIDKNNIQNDDFVSSTIEIEPLADKWKAFGWNVSQIDGHDMKSIIEAFEMSDKNKDKPLMIIANTIKGKGVSFMENNPEFHGRAPNEEETRKALMELNG